MKKLLLLLLCFVFASFSQDKNGREFDFVGEWADAGDNDSGAFTFEKDGTASIRFGDKVMGGKDYYAKGRKAYITYAIDSTTKPINIDLIVHVEGINDTMTIALIAKIIDANSINIATNFDENRPKRFTKKNLMVLERVKK